MIRVFLGGRGFFGDTIVIQVDGVLRESHVSAAAPPRFHEIQLRMIGIEQNAVEDGEEEDNPEQK